MKKVVCPYCNSNNIAEFVYGEVVLDEELKQDLEKGEIVLGGCCIEKDYPSYHCNKCGKDFGKVRSYR